MYAGRVKFWHTQKPTYTFLKWYPYIWAARTA